MKRLIYFSIVLLFALCVSVEVTAQNTNAQSIKQKNLQSINALSYKKSGEKFLQKDAYADIDGSPYYYDEKMTADLIYHSGAVMEDVPFQIDIFAKEFIGTDKDGNDLYLDMKFYEEVRVANGDQIDIFRRVHPQLTDQLFKVLYQDEHLALIELKDVKQVESSLIVGGRREHVNKFNQTTSYQIIRDENVEKVILKKKKFFKAFSKEEANVMKDYANQNKLSLKSPADYAMMLSALDGYLSK